MSKRSSVTPASFEPSSAGSPAKRRRQKFKASAAPRSPASPLPRASSNGLRELRRRFVFSNATRVIPDRSRLRVLDASGRLLGFAVRTSPQADNISGYRGPTECLVALGPDGRTITGVRVRRSYDTDSYVDQIRKAEP